MSAIPQQLPTFGRKFEITVQLPDSTEILKVADDHSTDPEALRLRATFDIYCPAMQGGFWYADICLYNLDRLTTGKLLARPIRQGAIVTVSAGYRYGNYGVIWRGPVFQPLFDRENVVDFKITLHCILGLNEFTRNSINAAYGAGATQYELVQQIANSSFRKIPIDSVSSALVGKKLHRGGVLFGNPDKYLTKIANDNNMQWWFGLNGLNLGKADDDVPTQSVDFVYTPNTGIIGVPQQTQYGVDFRVLLDPRIRIQRPLPVVKIDNSVIRQQKLQIGEYLNILDQDGEYIAIAARHFGDTRGNEWYTDITGLTSTGGKLAMLQTALGGNPDISTNTPTG
jgi:hypothetical protein